MFDGYRLRKLDALERRRDVAGLAKLLRHDQSWVVSRAAGALVAIGGPEVAGVLLEALDEAGPEGRVQIVHKLGEVGDPSAVEPLIALLNDTGLGAGSSVGEVAAEVLGQIGGPAAIGAIVDVLVAGDYPGNLFSLRRALTAALEALRVPDEAPAVHRAAATVPAADRGVTRDAAERARRLSAAGDHGAALAAVRDVRDAAGSVRASTGEPWGGAEYAAAIAGQAAATLSRLDAMTQRAAAHPDKPAVGTEFEERELDGLFPSLDGFLSTLPDGAVADAPPPGIEQAAGAGNYRDGAGEVIVNAMSRLLRSEVAENRVEAVKVLRGVDGPEPIAVLRGALDDGSGLVRRAALNALHHMGGLVSVADLRGVLDDESWTVRLAAVAPLHELGGPDAVDALRGLEDDEAHEVRMAVVAALARADAPAPDDVLGRAVLDPHAQVRLRAAQVIADLDDRSRAGLLAPLLTDPSARVRKQAASALVQWRWEADDTRQRVQLVVTAGDWTAVVEAGATAAEPLVHMLAEVYAEGDPEGEKAVEALERLVAVHGAQIPRRVLEAGTRLADPKVWIEIPDTGTMLRLVDASGLRRLCQEALDGEE